MDITTVPELLSGVATLRERTAELDEVKRQLEAWAENVAYGNTVATDEQIAAYDRAAAEIDRAAGKVAAARDGIASMRSMADGAVNAWENTTAPAREALTDFFEWSAGAISSMRTKAGLSGLGLGAAVIAVIGGLIIAAIYAVSDALPKARAEYLKITAVEKWVDGGMVGPKPDVTVFDTGTTLTQDVVSGVKWVAIAGLLFMFLPAILPALGARRGR